MQSNAIWTKTIPALLSTIRYTCFEKKVTSKIYFTLYLDSVLVGEKTADWIEELQTEFEIDPKLEI